MGRLTYRSLLLCTVVSMGHIVYGSGIASGRNNELSSDFESRRSERAQERTTQRAEGHSAVTAQESRTLERPQEHYCPITHEVMKDPVVASDGVSYERDAIACWIASNGTSPMTRQSMSDELHPNQSLKILINDWQGSQEIQASVLSGLSPDEIVKLLKQEYDKNSQLLAPERTAKDKDIVVFLGNTGAGKSTLINFLANKELKVVGTRYELADDQDQNAMPIGTKRFKSETLYPKSIDIGNLRFFDLPGLNDTDGSVRNLVNAAFVRRILLDAQSVRCVYVTGQDQFTAGRGASIKEFTKKIHELFVMSDTRSDPVKEGLFVITKEDHLIDEEIATAPQEFPEQIRDWYNNQHIERMYTAREGLKNSAEHRGQILEKIGQLKSLKLSTLNVSALYPAETSDDLKRMYTQMFEDVYTQKKEKSITTVSEYQKEIKEWKEERFWEKFEEGFYTAYPAALMLTGFTEVPYQKAAEQFVKWKGVDQQTYIKDLERRMNSHIDEIKRQTEARAEVEIRSIREDQGMEGIIPFDFANHVMYQERVCGKEVLEQITSDVAEHEIMRGAFSDWLRAHYQQQADALTAKSTAEIKRLEQKLGEVQKEFSEFKAQWNEQKDFVKIPEIVRGHEKEYRQFLNGKLVYKPNQDNDEGRMEYRIGDLDNPLSGNFDISGCGDSSKYLSISTGYRQGKKVENSKKIEIWLSPRFLIERNLETTASHFQGIMGHWCADWNAAIFWTSGDWDDLNMFDYLTANSFDQLSGNKLYEKCQHHGSRPCFTSRGPCGDYRHRSCSPYYEQLHTSKSACFMFYFEDSK